MVIVICVLCVCVRVCSLGACVLVLDVENVSSTEVLVTYSDTQDSMLIEAHKAKRCVVYPTDQPMHNSKH